MYLHEFYIANYRSIDEQLVKTISNLNVLIGKNNSGKSTILNAIQIFFSSLRSGEVVILDSPIQQALDFHNHVQDEPIDLLASLRLSLAERDELINDIATQVPEMKNAISNIPTDLLKRRYKSSGSGC
jgi:predicted ATP-dependent endonuclease of OLD family